MYNVGADGDRQAFPVAWKALRRPYHLVMTAPASAGYRAEDSETEWARNSRQGSAAARGLWCGATEVQHDLHGRPLFLHRSMDKLNKRAVRPAGAAANAPRVTPWKTVHHWSNNEIGVWGETRVEYGCAPRSTLWLAGCVALFLAKPHAHAHIAAYQLPTRCVVTVAATRPMRTLRSTLGAQNGHNISMPSSRRRLITCPSTLEETQAVG